MQFKVLRPTIHARDIEVEDIVVVDGGKTEFCLAIGIGGSQSNQFIPLEKSAFEVVNTIAIFILHRDGDAVGTYGKGSSALYFGRERLVEPSTETHIAQGIEGIESPTQYANLAIHGDER